MNPIPVKKNVTQRLNDVTKQCTALQRAVAALPDGADPFQLSGVLNDLQQAISATQTRMTVKPNETVSKASTSEATFEQIAELEKIYSRPSEPIQARLEVERSHLLGLTEQASDSRWKDELSALEQLNGQVVTVVWDPVLGMGRIDATEAAAAAFNKG